MRPGGGSEARGSNTRYLVMSTAAKPWQFFDLQEDPFELNNLVDVPAWRKEIERHHRWMRERMIETVDSYILKPAWGQEGLNIWDIEVPDSTVKK